MPRKPKGTVSIESVEKRLRLRLPRHVFGGAQRYLTLGLPDTPQNREIAEAKAKIIEADITLENFDHSLRRYRSKYALANDEPLLTDLWAQFVEFKRATTESTTIATTYRTVGNHISELPTHQIAQAQIIRKHLRGNLSPKSAQRTFNYIKACCAWALNEELITTNPFQFLTLKAKSSAPDINPFTIVERDQIILAFENNRYYSYYTSFVKFCFFSGCRQSEAIGLHWENISQDLSTILFCEAYVLGRRKPTKTNEIRRFPVNAQLKAILQPLKLEYNHEGLVFRSKRGGFIDSHNFLNRAWMTILDELPTVRYRKAYNTRHTFITLCLEAGIPVQQVASWVGNSPKTIWNSYAGIVTTVDVPEL